MAGSAVIGALRVNLSVDTAAFDQGLRSAGSSLERLGTAMKVGAAAIATGMVAALGGLAAAMKGSIDDMDEMSKTSQKMGVPVDQLGRLKYAADLSGVSMEGLTTAFTKLSKNMSEIAAGAGKQAAAAFDTLGISVKNSDGTLRSANDVMQDVAAKFADMNDGAAKTALAMQIFGKSGADLIPLLNSGASGLKEMGDEAQSLGLVFSAETAKGAEAFNDNLTRMAKIQEGVVTQISVQLVPTLRALSDAMVMTATNTDLMSGAATAISYALKGLASVGLYVGATIGAASDYIKGFITAATELASGNLSAALAAVSTGVTDIGTRIQTTGEIMKTIWGEAATSIVATTTALPTLTQAPLETLGLQVGAVNAQIQSTALSTQGLSVALIDGGAIMEENLTPAETYRAKMAEIDAQLAAGQISQEQYARASKKLTEQYSMTWDVAAASIAGSMAKITGSFGKNNEAMATAAKAFGIAQAIISTYTGMAKALELPFPANLAAAAAVAAQGFSFVASIKSQAIPSFAHGGSFKVGGAGGIDNNRVMMDLTRGERVDITPAGQDRGGDGRPISVTLNGESFGRNQIEKLFETINEGLSDGYQIKLRAA